MVDLRRPGPDQQMPQQVAPGLRNPEGQVIGQRFNTNQNVLGANHSGLNYGGVVNPFMQSRNLNEPTDYSYDSVEAMGYYQSSAMADSQIMANQIRDNNVQVLGLINELGRTIANQIDPTEGKLMDWFTGLNALFNRFYEQGVILTTQQRKIRKNLYNEFMCQMLIELEVSGNTNMTKYMPVPDNVWAFDNETRNLWGDGTKRNFAFGITNKVYNHSRLKYLKKERYHQDCSGQLIYGNMLNAIYQDIQMYPVDGRDAQVFGLDFEVNDATVQTPQFLAKIKLHLSRVVQQINANENTSVYMNIGQDMRTALINDNATMQVYGKQVRDVLMENDGLRSKMAHWVGRGYVPLFQKYTLGIQNNRHDIVCAFIVHYNETEVLDSEITCVAKGGSFQLQDVADYDDYLVIVSLSLGRKPVRSFTLTIDSATVMGTEVDSVTPYNPRRIVPKPKQDPVNWSNYIYPIGILSAQSGIFEAKQGQITAQDFNMRISDTVSKSQNVGKINKLMSDINKAANKWQKRNAVAQLFLTVYQNPMNLYPEAIQLYINELFMANRFELPVEFQRVLLIEYYKIQKKTSTQIDVIMKDQQKTTLQLAALIANFNNNRAPNMNQLSAVDFRLIAAPDLLAGL